MTRRTIESMSALEARIPPPAVATLFGLGAWGLHLALPQYRLSVPMNGLGALLLAGAGLAVASAAMRLFKKANTTIDPRRPDATTSLVDDGIYGWTRNPMYVGLSLVLLAWCVWLSNLASLVAVPLFVLFIDRFQIQPEERALRAKMGEAYEAYCRRVRRWV